MTNDEGMTKPKAQTGRSKSFHHLIIWHLFRHSTFVLRHSRPAERPRSHVLDDVIAKLRTLDLGGSIHQTRDIVRNTFARNRALQAFENQISRFYPAHVTEHHFA